MDEKQGENSGPEALLKAWMSTSAEFMGLAARAWSGRGRGSAAQGESRDSARSRMQETLDSTLKTWQSLSWIMEDSDAVEGLVKGLEAFPKIMLKVMKPAWEGFFRLQQEWMERAGRIGQTTAAYDFETLDQDAFKAWSEIYEKEFRQFLKIPQLGLARFYQERINEAADKFNVFQAKMAEFISLVYLPMERSLDVMRDQLTKMADEGKLPEKSKEYYRMWVKILEGHYMTLFKSPQYTQTVARTLDALGEFSIARQKMLEDALQSLPVATQKEMDGLYKEIYLLKKRVKELEKKNMSDDTDDRE